MYPADVTIAISGKGFRPMKAAPVLRGLMFELFVRPVASVEGASVSLNDGEELPIAGGLKAIQCVWPLGLATLCEKRGDTVNAGYQANFRAS